MVRVSNVPRIIDAGLLSDVYVTTVNGYNVSFPLYDYRTRTVVLEDASDPLYIEISDVSGASPVFPITVIVEKTY